MTLSIFLLILLVVGIILLEGLPLLRKKAWRDLIVFTIILALGFGLSLGYILDWPLPNPSRIIAGIFRIKY